jgi:peroxiredoxin
MKKRTFIHAALAAAMGVAGAPVFAQQVKEAQKETQKEIQKEPQKLSLYGIDAYGKKLALSDFLGKTVLVSFFTAGCSLCSRDLKLMREFYVGNSKRNFVLLAINLDQDKKDFDDYNKLIALAVPKEQRFPTVWRNAPEHRDSFGVITRQPTHFVINPKNQLVLKREGSFLPDDWDTLWESLEG